MIESIYKFMDSRIYDGMATPENPENLPLATLILQQIKPLDFAVPLIYGKNNKGERVNHRRYEFKVSGEIADGWGFFYLYIVGEENFLEDKGYRYTPLGLQAIPLTFQTISQLSDDEQQMIYNDLA